MKKIDKKDFLACAILTASFILFALVITHFKYYYGSTTDWVAQHTAIPDYFRTLFWDTHDLLPDFALNLGNGQNIYNFSYYGLLSPIILISYMLPHIDMCDYVVFSSILTAIVASILFYFFLRKKNENHMISFLVSFMLLFASSMTFHTHRHIMFVNYMPFLILGLYGVDKKLDEKKGWLLALSVFLMIMTSYYYSIAGIISLVIYGIYKYVKDHAQITLKDFMKDGLHFIVPIIIAIIASSIIILPTFYVILSSRGETYNTIGILDLILPSANINYVLYEPYGMGLTSILIFSIINLLFKKREHKFLGLTLTLMILFPLINYILNATMYIDSKILIPMLPLALLAIADFLDDLSAQKIEARKFIVPLLIIGAWAFFKNSGSILFLIDAFCLMSLLFIYRKVHPNICIIMFLIIMPIAVSIFMSSGDPLISYEVKHNSDEKITEAINEITTMDDGMYRISNEVTPTLGANNIYGNARYYASTLYSSTYNLEYNAFYYDTINNPVQNRNRVIMSSTPNIMYLMSSGNKYLISKDVAYAGYELVKEVDDIKIYKNDDVLPIAYAKSDVMSSLDFAALSYPESSEALLKRVIVPGETSKEFTSNIKKVSVDLSLLDFQNASYEITDDYYIVKSDGSAKATYTLPDEYKDKIIFIRFKVLESAPCSSGDTAITIEGTKNKLTCTEWKYHNQNYQFDYIISNNTSNILHISFLKGEYKISDIEMWALDYKDIENVKDDIDEFIFDNEETKGDVIKGTIDVSQDGYFVTSIPYDEGFKITVDGTRIDYEKVNVSFLGFKIDAGHHEIVIEYEAPLKKLSICLSAIGILLFIFMTVTERKKLHDKSHYN